MIVENLFSSIKRGIEGLNIGLSSGFPKLDTFTFGIQRKWITVLGGDSGSGNEI